MPPPSHQPVQRRLARMTVLGASEDTFLAAER